MREATMGALARWLILVTLLPLVACAGPPDIAPARKPNPSALRELVRHRYAGMAVAA